MSDADLDQLARFLIILPVGGWVATVLLWAGSLAEPHLLVLRERAVAAAVLSVCGTIIAVLGLDRLLSFGLPSLLVSLAIIGVFIALSIPSYIWLALYWLGDRNVHS
jgi:hypothetical protein